MYGTTHITGTRRKNGASTVYGASYGSVDVNMLGGGFGNPCSHMGTGMSSYATVVACAEWRQAEAARIDADMRAASLTPFSPPTAGLPDPVLRLIAEKERAAAQARIYAKSRLASRSALLRQLAQQQADNASIAALEMTAADPGPWTETPGLRYAVGGLLLAGLATWAVTRS